MTDFFIRPGTILILLSCHSLAIFVSVGQAKQPDPSALTFEDVSPLFQSHCASCHRPGQSAPFSLQSYEEITTQAATIEAVIEEGYMPPWKPVSSGIAFANDRRLTEAQKQTMNQWISQGMRRGPQNEIESKISDQPDLSWTLGTPDLVVKMPEPFEVPADGPDIYRSFVFPVALPTDRWIKAMELRPTAKGAVHHALFFVDRTGKARFKRERDGQAGLDGMSFLRSPGEGFDQLAKNLNQSLGGYVPGATPNRLPDDLARFLPAQSDIIMQTHFHPTGRPTTEQAELAIYFSDVPPSQQLVALQVPALFGIGAGIDIPAGESHFEVNESFTLPIDLEAIEVGGHAHYLCQKMTMRAKLPDGQSITLLRIDDWDLDWQDQYQFTERVPLPKGTVLQVQLIFDNSEQNLSNPFSPPQRIQWGRQSTDEMGSMILNVVASDESQRPLLESEIQHLAKASIRKRIQSQAGWFQRITGIAPQPGLLFVLFDRNQDGNLQERELPKSHRTRMLDFLDTNRDRQLDRQEIKEAQRMLKQIMQEDF